MSINNERVIFALESSCDETSAAVLVGNTLKSNIISSQIKEHIPFGGVYPELAARLHLEKIDYVIDKAIKEAGIEYKDIDYICCTKGPGLPGALQIGMMACKTLASALNIPLVGVHHLMGHIYANEYIKDITYPSLAVIVSGGNTEIVHMKDMLDFEIIGETLDDAIGETFDKVARKLNLPYPGGVNIDRITKDFHNSIKTFPLPKPKVEGYNVSYSGLKSHLARMIDSETENGAKPLSEERVKEYAFTTEKSLVDQLVKKVFLAAENLNLKQIVFGGGVSANSYLREEVTRIAAEKGIEVLIPPLWCTTDNAAMIAKAGSHLIDKNYLSSLSCSTNPSLELDLPYKD